MSPTVQFKQNQPAYMVPQFPKNKFRLQSKPNAAASPAKVISPKAICDKAIYESPKNTSKNPMSASNLELSSIIESVQSSLDKDFNKEKPNVQPDQ